MAALVKGWVVEVASGADEELSIVLCCVVVC